MYAHYFKFKEDIGSFDEEFLAEIQGILGDFTHVVQRELDTAGDPLVQPDVIIFNGIEEDGHETFYLSADEEGFSCKTSRKAYDLPVCIVLLYTKLYYQDLFSFSSDGFSEWEETSDKIDGNWEEAIDYIEGVFGVEIQKEFVVSEHQNSTDHVNGSFKLYTDSLVIHDPE